MRITYYARRTERASIVQDAVLMEDLSVEVRGIEKYWILNGSSLLNLRPAPSNADVQLLFLPLHPPSFLSLEKNVRHVVC